MRTCGLCSSSLFGIPLRTVDVACPRVQALSWASHRQGDRGTTELGKALGRALAARACARTTWLPSVRELRRWRSVGREHHRRGRQYRCCTRQAQADGHVIGAEFMNFLLDHGAAVDRPQLPGHHAGLCHAASQSLVYLRLSGAGACSSCCLNHAAPLMMINLACAGGDIDKVRRVWRRTPGAVNFQAAVGEEAAAVSKRPSSATAISSNWPLAAGADPNAREADGAR